MQASNEKEKIYFHYPRVSHPLTKKPDNCVRDWLSLDSYPFRTFRIFRRYKNSRSCFWIRRQFTLLQNKIQTLKSTKDKNIRSCYQVKFIRERWNLTEQSNSLLWCCLSCCTRWTSSWPVQSRRLLRVLYKVVLTLECVDETWCVRSKLLNRTVVLFIVVYKVILTFGSVGEILKCARPFKYYWAVLYFLTLFMQGGSQNFWLKTSKGNLMKGAFLFTPLREVVTAFQHVVWSAFKSK